MSRLKKGAFPKVAAAQWVKPKRRFYYLACCDCALVHKMEFALVDMPAGKGIVFRAWRAEDKTKALRKREKIRIRTVKK